MMQTINCENFKHLFKNVIPPLQDLPKKGSAGRIAIVGGSKNYTGAPFYAAMSCLRGGADLAYVICCKSAGLVLKSYSPELIVSPILDDESFINEFISLIPKLHSVVIGPGLGTDKQQFNAAKEIIKLSIQYDLPIVLDACSTLLIAECPDLIKGYQKAILTPNAREFDFLCNKLGLGKCDSDLTSIENQMKNLSEKLSGVTILRKDKIDFIVNNECIAKCDLEGSYRRCGGQGDILAGLLGTYSFWSFSNLSKNEKFDTKEAALIASFAACSIIRRASSITYKKLGRSMLSSDILKKIGEAFKSFGFE